MVTGAPHPINYYTGFGDDEPIVETGSILLMVRLLSGDADRGEVDLLSQRDGSAFRTNCRGKRKE